MSRLPGLDLLRAIAVIWVMLFHSFLVGGLGPDFAWLSRFGWMGVDIFFVLSGFLIGRQVLAPLARGERLSFAAFYSRRAWRIVPAFAVVLAIYVAFPALHEADGMAPWWQFATFTMNLLVHYDTQAAFSHAWSLCVEEHFYLVFPALAWWLTRRPSVAKFAGLCVFVLLAGIAVRTGTWLHDAALDPPRNWFVEDIYYPTWNRLDGLLAGVVLATLSVYRPALWARMGERANAFLVIGLLMMALAFWLFRERTGLLGNSIGWPVLSAAIACLVVAGASTRSWIGRWHVPGAAWIAAISYSLYLSHKLVFHAVDLQFGQWLQDRGLIAFAVYALATLAGGALLHYAVERPFLQLRARRESTRRSAAASGEPVTA
ncbi:acyltransferase family protein [Lysobacter sp. GCM10012299]|uniref:acyltransferase family protein n=1 Tax=Lysobacter sp. GCM10012299 TaxID=3317333 RepID=UPI00361A7EAA